MPVTGVADVGVNYGVLRWKASPDLTRILGSLLVCLKSIATSLYASSPFLAPLRPSVVHDTPQSRPESVWISCAAFLIALSTTRPSQVAANPYISWSASPAAPSLDRRIAMSTLEELDDIDRRGKDARNRDGADGRGEQKASDGDEVMKGTEADDILDDEILGLSTQDIQTRRRLLENDSRIMKSELSRLSHEKAAMGEKIKDNVDKIANNR